MSNLTLGEAMLAGSALTTILICGAIFSLLYIIATWRIFKKAGIAGWKSLIPIYNIYLTFKIVKMKSWFWYIICVDILASIVYSVYRFNPNLMTADQIINYDYTANLGVLIMLIFQAVVLIAADIIYAYRTSKVFGHGTGFTLGLIFFPNLFWLILGFDKSKYNKKLLKKEA